MKAEDAKSAAFDILGEKNDGNALELIRASANRLHYSVGAGSYRKSVEWDDDLNVHNKSALVLMMRVLAARIKRGASLAEL